MDIVQRQYARTAWTPADPLAGLEPPQRFAILMMRPTLRERLKVAPWRDPMRRRLAMLDIIAERRLAYDLAHGRYEQSRLAPAPPPASLPAEQRSLSPYYQHRMGLHRDSLAAVARDRATEDTGELSRAVGRPLTVAERRVFRDRLQSIVSERARLQEREVALLRQLEAHDSFALTAEQPRRTSALDAIPDHALEDGHDRDDER